MNTRTLLKKISWVFISLAFIVLIGLTIFQHRQIKKLTRTFSEQAATAPLSTGTRQATGPEKTAQNTTRVSINETAADSSDVEALTFQLQATEEELDMVHEDLNKEMDRKTELAQQRRDLQKKQFKDPSFKKFVRENIESQYSDFIDSLNLLPEDAEAFLDILFAEQMASQEFWFDAQEIINPTDGDRDRFKQLFEDLNAEYEAKKTELLGEDVYKEYESYKSKWFVEEYQVGGFSETLGSDEALTDTQRTALVDALVDAQEKWKTENIDKIEAPENTFQFPADNYKPENMERMMANVTRSNETFIEAARGILSASQTEKLETYLGQQFDMMTTSMKMAALEYGYTYDQEENTDTGE
jgi:hypothetical protein